MSDEDLPATTEVVVPAEPGAVQYVSEREGSFNLLQRRAKALAQSDLIPTAFKGNIPNCMIALELSERIGMAAPMIMQNLNVVRGKPTFGSSFLIGCINATRRFTPLRFEWEGERGTPEWGCRAVATDRETGELVRGPLVTWGCAQEEGLDQPHQVEGWWHTEIQVGHDDGVDVRVPERCLVRQAPRARDLHGPADPG